MPGRCWDGSTSMPPVSAMWRRRKRQARWIGRSSPPGTPSTWRRRICGLQALSAITYYRGAYDEAEEIQREALALNPNDPENLAQFGWRLAMRGRWEEGLGYLTQAINRSIDPPPWYYFSFAIHDYLFGDYAGALVAAEQAKRDELGVGWSLVAIIQAALGNPDEATKALAEMAARSPLLVRDPAAYFRFHRFDEAIIDRLVDGLHKAGWSGAGHYVGVRTEP